jgi:nucleotide-binding universal stress UspA family protein
MPMLIDAPPAGPPKLERAIGLSMAAVLVVGSAVLLWRRGRGAAQVAIPEASARAQVEAARARSTDAHAHYPRDVPRVADLEEHTMFKTIVVGIDGREGGRDALTLAGSLQRVCASEIVAVLAFPLDDYLGRGAGGEYEKVIHDRAVAVARGEVEGSGASARPFVVADGSPGRALHHAATAHEADLIVVGSAHRGRVGRVLAGDVSAGTLHGAPCPVLVAPRGYGEHGGELSTIGVGFDGSPESRAALEFAHRIAEAVGARLRVICVVVPPDAGGPSQEWAEHAHRRRAEAEERLAAALTDLGEIASGDLLVGDPARELADAAHDLDLLVTGSRGYGPVRRLMLGSTSTKLVHEAPCPVLVLTRGAQHDDQVAEAASGAAHPS